MSDKRKICVITGTRAEYGLLSRLMHLINDSDKTTLQIIATNMHLSEHYGNTYKEIESDGFIIEKKVPIMIDGPDNYITTLKSMSVAISSFTNALDELKPDIIVVLGDRYEILAAATVALISKIPIAHIHGGEITEGAYDDAIRHSITKMSHLHFPATEQYRQRIIQLGEQPDRVFNTGSPGVENIRKLSLMTQNEIETSLNLEAKFLTPGTFILVTYHPITLSDHTVEQDIKEFIDALNERPNIRILFTMPNCDAGASAIFDAVNKFVERNPHRAVAFKSLGIMRYLSAMSMSAAVVGNSSSGLIEVPSFGVPTLNIGDRQKGRISANSVTHCRTDKASILQGLDYVLSSEGKIKAQTSLNPYEQPNTSEKIFDIISTYPLEKIIQKHFHDYKEQLLT